MTTTKVNYTALSRQARGTIKAAGMWHPEITIASYVRHWFPDDGQWHGDTCGCCDDRCIGHHHDGADGCHCLEVLLDIFIDSLVDARSFGASHVPSS